MLNYENTQIFIPVKVIAEQLGISTRKLKSLETQGLFPVSFLGLAYIKSELDEYLASRRVHSNNSSQISEWDEIDNKLVAFSQKYKRH